jgi:hypothetical protein
MRLPSPVIPARGPLYKRWLWTPAFRGDDDKRPEITVSRKLSEIAKTIRSKNAGLDKITFDVILATYDPCTRQRSPVARDRVPDLWHRNGTNHRSRRVRPGTRDQVHDLPADTERQYASLRPRSNNWFTESLDMPDQSTPSLASA